MPVPIPRSRVSDLTSSSAETLVTYGGPGCTTTTSTTGAARLGVYRKMDDFVVPGFRALAKRGQVFNNPMTRYKYTFSKVSTGHAHELITHAPCATVSGAYKASYTNLLNAVKGRMSVITPPAQILNSSGLITSASTLALANVKNPSVQGLAFIGEIQQTLSLLRNPIEALTKYAQRRRPTKLGAAGAVSSEYLAYVFGVLPLMHDIEGIIDALFRLVNERETARGHAADGTTVTSTPTSIFSDSVITGVFMQEIWEESIDVRAGVLYAFEGRTLVDSLGVSLRDIPAAMWELLPWSFVVDWFSNVGKVISACTAAISNEFLAQWLTVKRTTTYTRKITNVTLNPLWFPSITCRDKDVGIYETYTRIPTQLASNIGFQFNLSLNRTPILSALSLLIQTLTKGK